MVDVSVIIPYHRDRGHLADAIASYNAQEFTGTSELILSHNPNYSLGENFNAFHEPILVAPKQHKKVDMRRYRPNEPLQPSKGQKKTTRPFARGSNLTDLLGTDIFGAKSGPFENGNDLFSRPSEAILKPQPSLNRKNSSTSRFDKYILDNFYLYFTFILITQDNQNLLNNHLFLKTTTTNHVHQAKTNHVRQAPINHDHRSTINHDHQSIINPVHLVIINSVHLVIINHVHLVIIKI